ncbi:hypothetical protein RRF57_002076 [Xylaria bambusicola]|uniref:Uncharacterized protein n=1 Tax=Xylaria bambusicola TaxID=326684 RepID=A0AAN7Z6N1_9PEZI
MGLIEKIKFEVRMAHARWRVRRFLKNRPVTPYDPFGQHHPADAEGPNPRNQDSPEGYADAADFQPARSEEMTRALAEALDDKLPPDPAPDPTAKVELNPIIATMRVTVHSSNQSPEMSRALAVAGITD